jgi:hypothetical protein
MTAKNEGRIVLENGGWHVQIFQSLWQLLSLLNFLNHGDLIVTPDRCTDMSNS